MNAKPLAMPIISAVILVLLSLLSLISLVTVFAYIGLDSMSVVIVGNLASTLFLAVVLFMRRRDNLLLIASGCSAIMGLIDWIHTLKYFDSININFFVPRFLSFAVGFLYFSFGWHGGNI